MAPRLNPLLLEFIMTTFVTRLLALFLAFALLPSASAFADEDSTPTDSSSVSGVLTPTTTFKPMMMGFCEADCFDKKTITSDLTSSVDAEGGFTVPDVELGSTQKIAVVYGTYIYKADGSKKNVVRKGYLRTDGQYLVVTKRFAGGDTWTIDGDLGTLQVYVPQPAKQGPGSYVTADFEATGAGIIGGSVSFGVKAVKVQKGTTIVAKVIGCGGNVVGKKVIKGRSGKFKFTVDANLGKIKRFTTVELSARKSGHIDYNTERTYGPFNRPSNC